MEEVHTRTTEDSVIANSRPEIVYTSKKRIKEFESLKSKIEKSDREIDDKNLFNQVSDIAGIRLVVLHYEQMSVLDEVIKKYISEGRWRFRETPKAYESDIRIESDLRLRGFDVERKDSYYTSIHYLVEQSSDSKVCCEIQIRTILEEIWSEIDHRLRYKNPEEVEHVLEDIEMKLRVFSNIVQTGRSFLDLVFQESTKSK